MTGHDPRAADVLTNRPLLYGWDRYRTLGPRRAQELLDALTAADLAVIPVGSIPPWMERLHSVPDTPGNVDLSAPLYVRKENPDD